MIAVDTNVLVHAHRSDSPWNARAHACMSDLAGSASPWGIPWPCAHEFVAIVTHPRVFKPASTLDQAIAQMEAWMASPSLVLLGEDPRLHWPTLRELVRKGRVTGPQVHDARIAALCVTHGVRELWSADRDFRRFPTVSVTNPLIESA